MSSPALSLTPIVNVTVIVAPPAGTPPLFNVGCIIGPSARIPSVGANSRIRSYAGLSGMLTDGFQLTDPEYLAAVEYFGQLPQPTTLQVGRQDATSLKTIIPHSGSGGTNYAVGDIVTVVQGGASLGTATVATVSAGVVTGLTVNTSADGTGYSVANSLATTTNSVSGSGLLVDITAIGETPLVALQNCRTASSLFYSVFITSAVTADHSAIAAYVQAITPLTFYYANTADAAVLNNTAGNLALTLKAASYTNVALVYSTTQGGAAPSNIYTAAGVMGSVMGQNTGLPNSYFTEWGKIIVGAIAEPLTTQQIANITGNNCNLYVGYVNQYTIIQPGITPGGVYIDQVLNRAILQAAIQYAVMNLLVGSSSIPQTDPGETQIIHAVNNACAAAVASGYLSPGVYLGAQPVLALLPGEPLPAGYLSQAYPFATQSAADKQARKAMPVYTVINESGAVQSVVIGVFVNP